MGRATEFIHFLNNDEDKEFRYLTIDHYLEVIRNEYKKETKKSLKKEKNEKETRGK